ncbi:ABC transporter substrate-binding protein [Sagittula sp. MA-2]|jgi:putative spermidine/putrescine transport system substrate-binding protein|uniref:ABC transporter substrate-binding protein n=1 Tax=Sagittula sp. MA-2 TaxID=3048007 RepID=UPI0024C34C27|nr:ABC transporter substrate-binding protein [Sagittula sp. MA-2]WHZ37938.1 ABC transporter substrate-binding protein [Sagittula sp. MA-2]
MFRKPLTSTLSLALIAGVSLPTLVTAQTLTITAAGGDYGTALKEAMWGPAASELGFEIREESQSDSLAALRMQMMSGTVTTDVIHLGSAEAAQAAALDLLEPLDTSIVDMESLPEGARNDYCFPFDSYGTVMAWNTETFGENAPKTWAEFWDTEAFPGRRALRANAQDTLEIALLSDGVAPDEFYDVLSSEGGLDRAIARLAELNPDVAIWWTSGAQSTQILADGEVDLVVTWNGRAAAAKEQGPADYTFKGSIVGTDCLAVPAGSENVEDAMRLIAGMTTAEREAKLTDYILYGPMNKGAYETGLIPEDRLPLLATAPENAGTSVYSDPSWWVENGEAAQIAFDEMINR